VIHLTVAIIVYVRTFRVRCMFFIFCIHLLCPPSKKRGHIVLLMSVDNLVRPSVLIFGSLGQRLRSQGSLLKKKVNNYFCSLS